jgi:TrmH family RNA methyltransferase
LRDRKARDAEGVFVCEGPRVIGAALDAGVPLLECFVGDDASAVVREIAARIAVGGVPVREYRAKVGDTVTPQSIFAIAPMRRAGLEALDDTDLCVVAEVNDPGNAGTLLRSAAAAGAQAVVFGSGSVDAYNPKVVRASAGACFAVRIVEAVPVVTVCEALGVRGIRRYAGVAAGGSAASAHDYTAPTAFVLGHETRGLPADLSVDAQVTIPMQAGESLNLAMAGTVLLFEAARQRSSR